MHQATKGRTETERWQDEAWDRFCQSVDEGRSDNIQEVLLDIPPGEFDPLWSPEDVVLLTEGGAI